MTDEKPKLKDIYKYVKPFAAHKWDEIGLELEVVDEDGRDLDRIKEECKGDKEDCFKKIMTLWVQSEESTLIRTWKVLLDCLRVLNLNEAVQTVESRLLNRKSIFVDAGLLGIRNTGSINIIIASYDLY